MSMALLDRVIWVDPDSMRVRCCGCQCLIWLGYACSKRPVKFDQAPASVICIRLLVAATVLLSVA
jgi:hypothetical protein